MWRLATYSLHQLESSIIIQVLSSQPTTRVVTFRQILLNVYVNWVCCIFAVFNTSKRRHHFWVVCQVILENSKETKQLLDAAETDPVQQRTHIVIISAIDDSFITASRFNFSMNIDVDRSDIFDVILGSPKERNVPDHKYIVLTHDKLNLSQRFENDKKI